MRQRVAGPFTTTGFSFCSRRCRGAHPFLQCEHVRDPNANWVAPLLTKGAAASLGNVYEPYLQLTANLNVFNDRLLHGFTFAESAYMSTARAFLDVSRGGRSALPALCVWLQLDSKHESRSKTPANWKMYHDFAVKNLDKPAPEYRKLAREAASRASNGAMLEDLGLMEAHDGNWSEATGYFQQMRACYTKRDDILRAVLEEADAWVKQENPKRALTVIRGALRVISDSPTQSC